MKMPKQEKECLKCGNDFENWENQEMCNECEEEEKSPEKDKNV